jgi:hypothetical protein
MTSVYPFTLELSDTSPSDLEDWEDAPVTEVPPEDGVFPRRKERSGNLFTRRFPKPSPLSLKDDLVLYIVDEEVIL